MSRILVVDDDPLIHELIEAALKTEGHTLRHASSGEEGLAVLTAEPFDLVISDFMMGGMNGVEFMTRLRQNEQQQKCMMMTAHSTPEAVIGALREKACEFLGKPFTITELREAVAAALVSCLPPEIEIISASPEWIELRVPCTLDAVPMLQKLMKQIVIDLPHDTREAIGYAFRELLNNAIEHGGKLDASRFVTVSCVRTQRAIIYCIKDPGEGFDPKALKHAAFNNPADDPAQHIAVREEKGMRAGGFGLMLVRQMVDELVYNQKCNELMFIKYL